ncbi:hypothetical protein [Brevibacillus sp. SYSU BS000544]|uniref:hypothetical protein n=1 Tax=Brevibacillus sp. SYSU BS000544 TaxID=3416443 RepID=UPI003CE471D0
MLCSLNAHWNERGKNAIVETQKYNLSTQLSRVLHDIQMLSSPEFSGRLSGTEGAFKAAHYLSSSLHSLGLMPVGTNGFLTTVEVPAARLQGPVSLTIDGRVLKPRIDFAEYTPYTSGGSVSGKLLVLRDSDEIPHSEYKGKIILISERPENFDVKGTIASAVEFGVAALLIESGEPNFFHKSIFGSEKNQIPVFRIRRSVASSIAKLQGSLVDFHLPLVTSKLTCHNVLGFIPGIAPERTVVLSAHYDHLGMIQRVCDFQEQ